MYSYFVGTPSIANTVSYPADDNNKLYTYYPIFLNEMDNYTVYRNQFFDIRVTGAKGLGFKTPGDLPIDAPLIELTQLEVDVNVLDWEHKLMDTILGE